MDLSHSLRGAVTFVSSRWGIEPQVRRRSAGVLGS